MSLEIKSPTQAILGYPVGGYNDEFEIEATKDGLQIAHETLSWDWLLEAWLAQKRLHKGEA